MREHPPDTRRTPARCSRPTKSHRADSICSAVIPIRAIIAFIAGGGEFISCASTTMVGQTAHAASRQGGDRLVTALPEPAVGHAGAILDAIPSARDRLLYGRCS